VPALHATADRRIKKRAGDDRSTSRITRVARSGCAHDRRGESTMSMRVVIYCAIGFLAGAAALPIASGMAGGSLPAQSYRHHATPSIKTTRLLMPHQHHLFARTEGHMRAGLTPTRFLGVVDSGCVSFSTSSQEEANSVTSRNDPRLQPCLPTVSGFAPGWSGMPSPNQLVAWHKVAGDLAIHHPHITFAEAKPLIEAALATVR